MFTYPRFPDLSIVHFPDVERFPMLKCENTGELVATYSRQHVYRIARMWFDADRGTARRLAREWSEVNHAAILAELEEQS